MVKFPVEFFEKEDRWEHPVGELMKRVWAAQIEVLQRVIAICEKYQLTYYMYWGSLLGTIRHKGFIPWDDDIDIALKRDDYIKFLEVAMKELPQGYCLLNAYTQEEWGEYFSRITNSGGINYSEKWLEEYHGCPFSIGIDIFPLYYIPDDEALAKEQVGLLQLIGQLCELIAYRQTLADTPENKEVICSYEETIWGGITMLEQYSGYQFGEGRSVEGQLFMLYDQISGCYEAEESSYLTAFPVHLKNGYRIPKELLEQTVLMPFENIMVSVPVGYEEILTKTYGNYMVPRKGTSTHGEMFYEDQLNTLAKRIEELVAADNRQNGQMLREMQTVTEDGEEMQIPAAWLHQLYTEDENGVKKRKKVVVFCNTVKDFLLQDSRVIDKLNYVLSVFKDNQEVLLWWRPCRMDTPSVRFLRIMTPDTIDAYEEVIKNYKAQGWGICDETRELERAVKIGDAFYGDDGEALEKFKAAGKMAMRQNYKIC